MPEVSQRFEVLGLPVDILNNYPVWLTNRLAQKQGTLVITLNAEMAMQAEVNPQLAEVIRQADLVIPDGAGVVLYLKLYGRQVKRCPGIELAEALLRSSAQTAVPWSVFFYGGAPGVTEAAAATWQKQLPDLAIAGTQHGYHTPEEAIRFQQQLKDQQPEIIFVGLGVPRQELWIAQHRHLCPNSTWVGVGGSFDIWAGTKSRAPSWLRDNHLEWVYRLYKEPWRWRRMLALPKFAWRALITKFG